MVVYKRRARFLQCMLCKFCTTFIHIDIDIYIMGCCVMIRYTPYVETCWDSGEWSSAVACIGTKMKFHNMGEFYCHAVSVRALDFGLLNGASAVAGIFFSFLILYVVFLFRFFFVVDFFRFYFTHSRCILANAWRSSTTADNQQTWVVGS